jgi:HlyD family secretion protein
LQLRDVELQNLKLDLDRNEALRAQGLVSEQDYLAAKQRVQETQIQRQIAAERLSLMEEGRIDSGHGAIETVIRSPIDGYILEYDVEVGYPVVPLSTYQEGTVLIKMAEMKNLLFRGTVDEIDVGRLKEGMPVELKIGALPDAKIAGRLTRISLKAKTENNATVFPVEITLTDTNGATLRAGYSANANVIVERRDSVLMIPERVVTTKADTARVTVLLANGERQDRVVKLGLSDAINVEVLDGLAEGDRLVEPPPREIK